MADWFPRGSAEARGLWLERHRWLAGFYYSTLSTLLAVFLERL